MVNCVADYVFYTISVDKFTGDNKLLWQASDGASEYK